MSKGSSYFSEMTTACLGHGYFYADLSVVPPHPKFDRNELFIPAELRLCYGGARAVDLTIYCGITARAGADTEYEICVFRNEGYAEPLIMARIYHDGERQESVAYVFDKLDGSFDNELVRQIVLVLHVPICRNILFKTLNRTVAFEHFDSKAIKHIEQMSGVCLSAFSCHLFAML